MPADLTPERRVELRAAVDAAKEEADENEYFGRAEGYRHSADDAMRASFTLQTLFALLDAADENERNNRDLDAALHQLAHANHVPSVGTMLACAAEKIRLSDEVATLRAEVESHREARQMLADDLIALGKGRPGKLELSRGVEQRIAALEAENAKLRDDLAAAVEALAWASNEDKGRLPDWFHAIVAKHKGNA